MLTPPLPHACFFDFSDTCSLGSLGSNGSTQILVFDSFLEGRPSTGSRMLCKVIYKVCPEEKTEGKFHQN
jgi:hypothetical protein